MNQNKTKTSSSQMTVGKRFADFHLFHLLNTVYIIVMKVQVQIKWNRRVVLHKTIRVCK